MKVAPRYECYRNRRLALLQYIKSQYPTVSKGIIVLFASFEYAQDLFKQNSVFFYYTGLDEPGVVLTLSLDGDSIMWVPNYHSNRNSWVHSEIELTDTTVNSIGIERLMSLGASINGVEMQPYMPLSIYGDFQKYMRMMLNKGTTLFSTYHRESGCAFEQRWMLERLFSLNEVKSIVDISPIMDQMRRIKDNNEIELLYKAIDISCEAQEAAAYSIGPNINESEIQARINYIITTSGAQQAFPAIVASGINGTVIHYRSNNQVLKSGELIIIDVGARYGYYCGDISRTYPISGYFTKRQRELYELVLEAQKYIAQKAQPGYWIYNENNPEQSLQHLAYAYLKERGCAQYFIHKIGHFLGLDVHDVGDYQRPLQAGDVFTIEPGLYIPAECIGIRIEDDYWMTEAGAICLSEQLPKEAHEVEQLVQQSFNDKEKARRTL